MPRAIKNALYTLLERRHCRASIAKLKTLESRLPDPRARFAIPACFQGYGHCKWLKPYQHAEEIFALYERVLEQRPRRVLEIGTARGGTLYLWSQASADDAVIASIDLPGGKFGGGYRACRIPLYQAFARPGQSLHLVRQSSRDPALPASITGLMGGEPLDFLFIDADHRFEGVATNFRLYAPLVAAGGTIALHDILPSARNDEIEVHRLWARLEDLPTALTITHSATERYPLGIGVLTVPEDGLGDLVDSLPLVPDQVSSHDSRSPDAVDPRSATSRRRTAP